MLIFICSNPIFYGMGMRDKLTPRMEVLEKGRVRVIFYEGDRELACIYYEQAKREWSRKPLSLMGWGAVDAHIEDPRIFGEEIEPKELVAWGQEVISSSRISYQ